MFQNRREQEAILNPSQNSEHPKDIPSYGSQPECTKIILLSTDLVNTKANRGGQWQFIKSREIVI